MAVQSSTPSSVKDDSLGRTPKKALDASALGFDFSDLSPEAFDKIKAIIDSANSLLTEEEREYNREQKKKQIDNQKRFDNALEKAAREEIFEIPKKSGKTYRFIGYDTDQYKELMELGNKADMMTEEQKKTSKEFLDVQMEVFKKTILYSLENMSMDVLDKLPKRQIQWLYWVMKDKNDNPLPFETNA